MGFTTGFALGALIASVTVSPAVVSGEPNMEAQAFGASSP
jgi:hypothetical protein